MLRKPGLWAGGLIVAVAALPAACSLDPFGTEAPGAAAAAPAVPGGTTVPPAMRTEAAQMVV